MCAIESNYSDLIANHKFTNNTKEITSKFSDIHKEKVSLMTLTNSNVKLTYTEILRWVVVN